jgi:hypothetical protein
MTRLVRATGYKLSSGMADLQAFLEKCWTTGLDHDDDLEFRRTTRPREQPDEREQIPDDEIRQRPEQAALLEHDSKSAEPSQGLTPDEFANPTGSSRARKRRKP